MDIVKNKNYLIEETEGNIKINENNNAINIYSFSNNNNNNRSLNMVDIALAANCCEIIKSKIKCDENSCLIKLQKDLDGYLKDLNKSKKSEYYYPSPSIPSSSKIRYNLNKILEKAGKTYLMKIIKLTLKDNYNNSLIDDKRYNDKWSEEICYKYVSKFKLFSLGSLGENEPYNNTVTIFISGFLTEDKNSFAKNFENYIFSNNKMSDYYFYLWPSCGGPDIDRNICEIIMQSINTLNGIGCKFEEAYANAKLAGQILSVIIGSKLFFGNAKINLVGHSLGCRVICQCLEYFSENYQEMKDVFNDVILLAGATTIDDETFNKIVKEFVKGRFIHCYNKNDNALFISQSFSESPIGIRKIDSYYRKARHFRLFFDHPNKDKIIESYETNLEHTNYCENLENILYRIPLLPHISFIKY